MEKLVYTNKNYTIYEKFFIEKSLEILHIGTIDSYRVKVNNSKTILIELKHCLNDFNNGKIKHFHTIKNDKNDKKDGKAIIDEAIFLIEEDKDLLVFNKFSKDYFLILLKNLDKDNYKKIISCIDIILEENSDYLIKCLNKLETLLIKIQILENNFDVKIKTLDDINKTLNTTYSELIYNGFSKGFLYKNLKSIFNSKNSSNKIFKELFNNFKSKIIKEDADSFFEPFTVVFRIDISKKVYDIITNVESIYNLKNNLNYLLKDLIKLENKETNIKIKILKNFNINKDSSKFFICDVESCDYLSALKKAKITFSEFLDVINLGLANEFINVNKIALVYKKSSPSNFGFQNNINFFDGKYKSTMDHYQKISIKINQILTNKCVSNEAKEKIKSAVRYLRLGNESIEVEHKFINYWIGLEYLFSNYESQSTINRIKEHFITAHSLAYVKRNLLNFNKDFETLMKKNKKKISKYTNNNKEFLIDKEFYINIEQKLIDEFPLLAFRASTFLKSFFNEKVPNAKEYIKKHSTNLEIHFTRIYRLRNEIIHDAVTNSNNEQITSNLRYYLTFILNELIDFFSKNDTKEKQIEDFFVLNEIKMGNIEKNGYKLSDLWNIDYSNDFII